ncbi:hypothetical protein B0H63DRAFT_560729 [Podospora didyma]|uniref:Uncharacterized protein n=1 Tax=Podospora didyma TaxID=330526 RepID=A0AAE0TV70_9PEZI|nr:hypothetical protein B0H63DRAFT_560729 [Podospora didyma]
MGQAPDENLPEAIPQQTPPPPSIPDSAPEAVSPEELVRLTRYFAERDKYPVIFDNTPKYPSEGGSVYRDSQQWATNNPQSALNPDVPVPWDTLPAGADPNDDSPAKPKICGMRRRVFFLVLILVLAVVSAAVGGGVAGSAKARESPGAGPSSAPIETISSRVITITSTSPSSSSPRPTSVSTKTLTVTSLAGPTTGPTISFLNNQTSPAGLAFQGFEQPNYGGKSTPVIRDEGFHDLKVGCRSYVWLPDKTDCCVTFCANKTTATGYWCDARYRTNASGVFPRIYIWCNKDDNPGADQTCS